jgi:hypothetical protein
VAKADEAVRRVLDGLRQGKARAVWDFLPPSYREDIQLAVRDMALRLTEKDWRQFVAVAKKARRVLSEKQPALLGTDVYLDRPSRLAILLDLDALVRIMDVVSESDLSDLQRLQTIDVGRFLDTSGDKLLQAFAELSAQIPASKLAIVTRKEPTSDPFGGLESIQVMLVSSAGDQAVVRFNFGTQPRNDYDFIRVEGHWLPKLLADGWESGLAETRRQCLTWADDLCEHPESWQAHTAAVDGVLDDLDGATTTEESQRRWQLGLQKLVTEWLGSPQATSDSPSVEATETSSNPSRSGEKAVTTPRKIKRPDTEVLLPDEP